MAMAMGAENIVFERNGEVSIGVTYMTGSLVKLGQRMVVALLGTDRLGWVPYLYLWLSPSSAQWAAPRPILMPDCQSCGARLSSRRFSLGHMAGLRDGAAMRRGPPAKRKRPAGLKPGMDARSSAQPFPEPAPRLPKVGDPPSCFRTNARALGSA